MGWLCSKATSSLIWRRGTSNLLLRTTHRTLLTVASRRLIRCPRRAGDVCTGKQMSAHTEQPKECQGSVLVVARSQGTTKSLQLLAQDSPWELPYNCLDQCSPKECQGSVLVVARSKGSNQEPETQEKSVESLGIEPSSHLQLLDQD